MTKLALAALAALISTAAVAESRVWVTDEKGERLPYLCDEPYHQIGCRKDWNTIKRMNRGIRLPEVRSWKFEEDGLRRDCRPIVSVVGTEHVSEETAKKAAERAWMDQTRFLHGERYMALDKAHRLKSVCTRSSTGDSMTAKIIDKVTDGGGYLTRCQIEAAPCSVVPEEVGK